MLRRLRARLADESGQALILIAVAMPVFLAMGGLVIEGGHLFVAKRHLQNAADAAALASARDLPGNGNPCDASCRAAVLNDVKLYAGYNHFTPSPDFHACDPVDASDTNCYQTPYKGSNDMIQVRVRQSLPPIFSNAFGLGPFKVSASAAASAGAQVTTSTTPGLTIPDSTSTITTPASTTVVTTPNGTTTIVTPGTTTVVTNPDVTSTNITPASTTSTVSTITETIPNGGNGGVGFAMSSACPAITYLGAGGGSVGSLVTNGGISVSGAAKTVDSLAWGKRGTTGCDLIGSNATITKKIGPFSPQGWPVQPPTQPSPCLDPGTNSPGVNWSKTHAQGKYCVSGDLQFSGNGGSFLGYTWFATGSINLSGNTNTFSPYAPSGAPSNTPVFVALNGNLTLQGSGNKITGSVFAEHGNAAISGGGLGAGSGFVEAQTITITGNLASYTGSGGFGAPIVNVTTSTTMITIPASTTVVTTPGGTSTVTTPGSTTVQTVTGGTSTSTIPGSTTVTTIPGITSPGSTSTQTTATTVGLGE